MSTQNLKLSVIVPIYNGEKFLEKAVNSLLLSSISDLEILLIDDGSKDNSRNICQRLSYGNPEVRYYYKNNGGIVDARNYGLKKAKGKYIAFLDQDDFYNGEVLENSLRLMDKKNSDIIFFSTERYINDKTSYYCDLVFKNRELERSEIVNSLLMKMLCTSSKEDSAISNIGHVWGAIYKREIIIKNNITFKKIVDIEDDFLFLLDYLTFAQFALLITETGYFWRYNNESETYRLKYIPEIHQKYESLYRYMYEIGSGFDCFSSVKERFMDEAIQNTITRIIENDYTFKHFDFNTYLRIRKIVNDKRNRLAVSQGLLLDYSGRRKRIFNLIRIKLLLLSCYYVYFDSVYQYVKVYINRRGNNAQSNSF